MTYSLKRGQLKRAISQQGFTIIEMMLALVVAAIISAAGYTAVIGSQKATRVNEQVADTQSNSRIAMELLARDFKLAGFGMTTPVGACTVGGAAAPLVPSDNAPGGADTGPDRVSLVLPISNSNAAVGPLWELNATMPGPFGGGSGIVIPLRPGAVADMVASGLQGGNVSTISIGGAVSAVVSVIAGDTLSLQDEIGAPKVFPAGTQIFLLQCVTYQVIRNGDPNAGACGGGTPCLVRGVADIAPPFNNLDCNLGLPNNCVEVVSGIEDIQMAYACDACSAAINGGVADGIPDDLNASGTFDIGDFMTNTTWTGLPMTPDKIRMIQINVLARQVRADTGFNESTNTRAVSTPNPIVLSDHNPAVPGDPGFNLAAYQQERRRVLVRTVKARNIGS